MTVMNMLEIFEKTTLPRVSDGVTLPILGDRSPSNRLLVMLWPQLGDFDSLEYAWWLRQKPELLKDVSIAAVGIGNRASGEKFCAFTGFPADRLFMAAEPRLHRQIGLYEGLTWKIPGLSATQNAWLNLMAMCAGIGSPGTLKEVLRGYKGDRQAPQLIEAQETVKAAPLPPVQGSFFDAAGGSGFQRPFELATLRLRNMGEVLANWQIYVPDGRYLTQRGGTFLFDARGELIYEHRDRGILGFAANMSRPLSFLE
jgi:AhpC/TSA antioxidant enzyme